MICSIWNNTSNRQLISNAYHEVDLYTHTYIAEMLKYCSKQLYILPLLLSSLATC